MNMEQTYKARAAAFHAEAEALKSRYNRLALVRLAVFVADILLVVYAWGLHWAAGVSVSLFLLALFHRLIQRHRRIQEKSRLQEQLGRINDYEQEALQKLFISGSPWDDGAAFIDPHHPYAVDLDLFGPYSFFQYINRTGTSLGRQRLAKYLKENAQAAEISARQEAVAELSEQLGWRQQLQAYGLQTDDDIGHIELLAKWLDDPPVISRNRPLKTALYLMPIWITLGMVAWALFLPWYLGILFLVPPAFILRRTLGMVNQVHKRTSQAGDALSHYARLIRHIESGHFQAGKLKGLQALFLLKAQPASAGIERLSYVISQLNVRYNFFAVFLNLYALWDLQWVYRLEKWKEKYRSNLPAWFDALAEFETLSSLATLYFNNPEWSFPTLHESQELWGYGLGHPLIHPSRRVVNDLLMPTTSHIKLITGSNMAGKSTLLRTVGLNIVLASTGAPVCAQRLILPRLQVYTSMRTQDALHESTSSFYAELKRLKLIIEAVERRESAFFLLDEILKGTNSHDRHNGSRALIRQLIHSGGAGLIATHDLELGQLEAGYDGAIENLCMEVEIRDGDLFFDYKLKKGVSRSFNATLLMKNMGIKIEKP